MTILGRNNQSRAYARIFNEPDPTGDTGNENGNDDEAGEDGEVIEGEIIEQGEEEVVGNFHNKLDALYKQNNN